MPAHLDIAIGGSSILPAITEGMDPGFFLIALCLSLFQYFNNTQTTMIYCGQTKKKPTRLDLPGTCEPLTK